MMWSKVPQNAAPMSRARLRAAFALFDTDKSGFLDADELRAVLTRPGSTNPEMSKEVAEEIISEFDTNGAQHPNEFPSHRNCGTPVANRRARDAHPRR